MLSASSSPVAWISCAGAERDAGVLLVRILHAVAAAVPGAAATLIERLTMPAERVDAIELTRELIADLTQLLLEPVVVVVDDAERLEGADESLRLISELLRTESPVLRLAIATRRPLELRVAKPRADGRLAELGAVDLVFDAEECAALLQSRTGGEVTHDQVEQVLVATEGWPLGVALAAGVIERAGGGTVPLESLRTAPDLHAYLAEELLDSLDPELRDGVLASSVVPVVTPAVAGALQLRDTFAHRVEHAGLMVRHVDAEGAFVYHPLLREFLLERLRIERGGEEWRRLHDAVAPALADDGDAIGAIEHWLEAGSWAEAVAAMEQHGFGLVRTSPGLLRKWFSLLPPAERALPTVRALEGQIEWVAGLDDRAIALLRQAIDGFRERPNPPAEWVARSILIDLLLVHGAADEIEPVVDGWDEPAAAGAFDLAPAAAMFAAVALAAFASFAASDRLATNVGQRSDSPLLEPMRGLRLLFIDLPAGRIAGVCQRLSAAARAMEDFDPLGRRPHVLGALAIATADRGEPDEALALWRHIRQMHRATTPILTDATHAWCAMLHAQAGRLAEAEAELAQHRRLETGARAYIAGVASAAIAALRGDREATAAGGELALATAAEGPILFRYWAGSELVLAFATAGMLDRAREVLADTLTLIDEHYPRDLGSFPRGRLLGLRAWLHHLEGDRAAARVDVNALFEGAGEPLRYILRRDWGRLRPVVWDALESGGADPETMLDAITTAFPEGLQLVDFLDHPILAVRGRALDPAVRSGDPRALDRLARLAKATDVAAAAAASQAVERLRGSLPSLRFEVLGRFVVRRGSWRAGDRDWGRPVDARLVRFLLVHADRPVPEDEILEALWHDLSLDNARRSLHVSASRARRLLDAPGNERSMIERTGDWYRLALSERDTVDADEFRMAAELALSGPAEERQALLEHARSVWGGEPLYEERYSDWAAAYREGLIDRYTAVLTALAELHERAGEHLRAAESARELIVLDPLNEGAHRELMLAYARAGRTGYALRQYLECRRILVESLGIEPAEATSRLQARILAGDSV